MIHSASPQSRPAVIVAWFWSFGTDGRTDTLCENSDHYRPGLWSASWIKIWSIRKQSKSAMLYFQESFIFTALRWISDKSFEIRNQTSFQIKQFQCETILIYNNCYSLIDPLDRPTIPAGSDHCFHKCLPSVHLSVRPHLSKSCKTKQSSSENSDPYCRECGYGRVDHWWHLFCTYFILDAVSLDHRRNRMECWVCLPGVLRLPRRSWNNRFRHFWEDHLHPSDPMGLLFRAALDHAVHHRLPAHDHRRGCGHLVLLQVSQYIILSNPTHFNWKYCS